MYLVGLIALLVVHAIGPLILTYVLWIITGVLAIVGKWFVKFTEDGDDDRKRLTRWGRIGRPIVCICFVLALTVMFYGDFVEPRTDKEKFSPRLDIYVGVSAIAEDSIVVGDPENSKYYVFAIRNLNKTSVPIQNLIMTLSFSDSVVRLEGRPYIGIFNAPVKVYDRTPDIWIPIQESIPAELSIFKNFSYEVIKDKIKDSILNTNLVAFSCTSWAAESNIYFSGEAVTAPGETIEVSSLGRPGSYQGKFFYKIKGQTFSEKHSGKIVEQLVRIGSVN